MLVYWLCIIFYLRVGKIKKQLLTSVILSMMVCTLPAEAYMSPEANSLYQQACTYEYQQDLKSAVTALEKAIQISGNEPQLYTKLAGVYSDLGEYDKALDAYSKVTELRPTDAFIFISMGSIYEIKGDYKSALDAYNKAMALFPEYKYNYLNIANAQYHLKDFKSASETYSKFLQTYSQHKDARESLASSYLIIGAPDKAVVEYDKLYNADPNGFKDLANYGYALFAIKDYERASKILVKSIEKNPDDLNSRSALALAYQQLENNDLAYAQYQEIFKLKPDLHAVRFDYGNLLADMEKNSEAIEQYNTYIKYYPGNAMAYKNLGIVYKRTNNIDKAIENYEIAISKHIMDFDLKEDLAQCYHLKKDYENAIKYYDEILLVKKDNYDIKLNKAMALHALKKYPSAIALYTSLLQDKQDKDVQKNLVAALISQGQICYDAQDYTTAATYLEQAVSQSNEEDYGLYLLAKTYRECGMEDKAAEMYEKAIALQPSNAQYSNEYAEFIAARFNNAATFPYEDEDTAGDVAITAVTIAETPQVSAQTQPTELNSEKHTELIELGDENLKNKNYDECIKNYKEALTIRPSDAQTLFKLGYVYKLQNDNANAKDFYRKAIFVNPDFRDSWFNLGLIYADENNLSGAIDAFKRVVTIDPKYDYAYYALALAYETEKDYINAIKNYKLFLQNSNDDVTKRAVKDKLKILED